MGILTTGLWGLGSAALLSSCVIAYGVGFMLGQRKQEFALYQLMGMELRTVQRMFFWENGLLGLAAFGLGALLGTGLAGVLAQGVWWIFQTPHQYQVVASPKAGMTFLLFLLMYGVGALRAGRVLRRQSIQGLLTSRRANEVPGRWRPGRWFLLVAPALTGMALGLLLLRKALDMQTNGAWAYLAGGGGLLLGGVYALYRGLPGLLLAAARRRPKVKYSRGRLFYLGQMGRGGHGGTGAGGDGDSAHPGSDRPVCGLAWEAVTGPIWRRTIPMTPGGGGRPLTKQAPSPCWRRWTGNAPWRQRHLFPLETPYGTEAMALSDYNHLRRILDLEEAELGPGEYLVHCDTWNFGRRFNNLWPRPPCSLWRDSGSRPVPLLCGQNPWSSIKWRGTGYALWCRTRCTSLPRRAGGW
ncbi:MAG: FtsX-like permease family protein [Evtepia gabavorous]